MGFSTVRFTAYDAFFHKNWPISPVCVLMVCTNCASIKLHAHVLKRAISTSRTVTRHFHDTTLKCILCLMLTIIYRNYTWISTQKYSLLTFCWSLNFVWTTQKHKGMYVYNTMYCTTGNRFVIINILITCEILIIRNNRKQKHIKNTK